MRIFSALEHALWTIARASPIRPRCEYVDASRQLLETSKTAGSSDPLASAGLRVTVFEREQRFRDRVRGEGLLPWGVNEARDLGIAKLLEGCGRPIEVWTSHVFSKRSPRNLLETTPHAAPCLDFYHPAMQEFMIAAAAEAGAEVRRWAGFQPWVAPERLRVAGLLLEGGSVPDSSIHVFRNSSDGRGALFFPLGDGRTRAYAIRRKRDHDRPISGRRGVPAFLDACRRTGVAEEWLAGV